MPIAMALGALGAVRQTRQGTALLVQILDLLDFHQSASPAPSPWGTRVGCGQKDVKSKQDEAHEPECSHVC